MPRFSILLPTHNRPDTLALAIESALMQSEPDFELLVVGDGCTDNTSQVVQSFNDARVKWYDLPKAPGFGYANRNIALREAESEYIAFLGHDNLFFPDHLEKLGALLDRPDGPDLVYSRPLWMTRDGQFIPGLGSLHHPATRDAFLNQGSFIPATSIIYHSRCHEQYGYWDETLHVSGDWELWTRIVRGSDGQRVAYLPTPTCIHFQADWRTKQNFGAGRLNAWYTVQDDPEFLLEALKVDIPERTLEQAVVLERFKTQPGWIDELRTSVETVVERLAERYMYETVAFTRQHALAWKVLSLALNTGWLRKLRRLVAPPGSRREALYMRLRHGPRHPSLVENETSEE